MHGADEVENLCRICHHADPMSQVKPGLPPLKGQELITLAQTLARDAERHALLSESLASQAERLMIAGLRQLETRPAAINPTRISR